MALTYPVVVVPGITASHLRDEYQLPPELVWGVLERDYARVALHPDNLRYEALEPARVTADSILEVAYEELVEELRYNLRDQEDEPVPVYPFGYDWRQPLAIVEQELAGFVDEVIARTRLIKHYDKAGYGNDPRVNLVGHSMGGLVIAGWAIDWRLHDVLCADGARGPGTALPAAGRPTEIHRCATDPCVRRSW